MARLEGNRTILIATLLLSGAAWSVWTACPARGAEVKPGLGVPNRGASIDSNAIERLFSVKILPLFKAKCLVCHGDKPEKIKGKFDMRDRARLLKGGDSDEAAVVPGHPEKSLLFAAIKWEDDLEMPPKENDRLTAEQIKWVQQWIKGGAPWPSDQAIAKYRKEALAEEITKDGMLVKTSGGLSVTWTNRRYRKEDVWAFLPITSDARKSIKVDTHPVDAFVQAKLKRAGFAGAPRADARTLIRRATFDLIGLPPTPEEIEAFVAASKKNAGDAWRALIDRLLASPHYGERWGQHWLDVARYADTGGYSNDYERSNMWRYRDYVIRAFNNDKPYDQFIVEQIAGDELADASVAKRLNAKAAAKVRRDGSYTAEEAEWLVATSFLRMGQFDPAMTLIPQARQIYLDDVVNAVGQTFLSTTLRCVKCHDHKFDPIPTRDYYRFYAAFAATQMAERAAPFTPEENRDGFEKSKALTQRLLAFATERRKAIVHKRETAARKWFKEHNLPYVDEQARRNLPDEKKPPRHAGLDHVDQGRLKVREQDERIWTRRLERYQPMVQSVYNGPDPQFLNGRRFRMPPKINGNAKMESFIYTGGAIEAKGERVSPGILSAIGLPIQPKAKDPFLVTSKLEGRRLGLANWIAHKDNQLTSRSLVNRLWQHHFGKPLAGNPNNFGVKGLKPTHPKLLDWLAANFVDNGWKMKRMHRLIMTSAAYQQAGHHADLSRLRNSDPNNDLFAYFPPRRLSAEELRDSMLKVSGELNASMGGLPAMPEINMEVALQPRMIQFSIAPAYQPSPTPAERNRRSIYAYRVRGQADPFLEVFNQPTPNASCEARDSASVSPQAFTLLNSDVVTDRSIAFAQRLQKEAGNAAGQVTRAFQLAFGRDPGKAEQTRMERYLKAMHEYHAKRQPKPVAYPTQITRSLVEELSGKVFEYQEILPVFENYQPDSKAADVPANTRALADLCLLLFNSNEFVFVY